MAATASSNRALHVIAITRGRIDPQTRAYLARKEAEGKSRIEGYALPQDHGSTLMGNKGRRLCNRRETSIWLEYAMFRPCLGRSIWTT